MPMAFFASVPNTLFPESSLDGSFDGWRFDESAGLQLETQVEQTVDEAAICSTGKGLAAEEELESEDSMESNHSDSEELSSDGSGGSRSRSEQSDGDDWPQPLLKRIRGP